MDPKMQTFVEDLFEYVLGDYGITDDFEGPSEDSEFTEEIGKAVILFSYAYRTSLHKRFKDSFQTVALSKGRFGTYILTFCKNFLKDSISPAAYFPKFLTSLAFALELATYCYTSGKDEFFSLVPTCMIRTLELELKEKFYDMNGWEELKKFSDFYAEIYEVFKPLIVAEDPKEGLLPILRSAECLGIMDAAVEDLGYDEVTILGEILSDGTPLETGTVIREATDKIALLAMSVAKAEAKQAEKRHSDAAEFNVLVEEDGEDAGIPKAIFQTESDLVKFVDVETELRIDVIQEIVRWAKVVLNSVRDNVLDNESNCSPMAEAACEERKDEKKQTKQAEYTTLRENAKEVVQSKDSEESTLNTKTDDSLVKAFEECSVMDTKEKTQEKTSNEKSKKKKKKKGSKK